MIRVDLDSRVPLEEQVRQEIREAIARGEVAPGEALPSVRQLAGDLDVHWNTVARAYRGLRDEGLLVVGRGRGVHVREGPARGAREKASARRRVDRKIREALTEARLGGLGLDQVLGLVERQLELWKEGETA